MSNDKQLNNFDEGMVCPTHGGFQMWQLVWMMSCNTPTQVRIVGINIKGFYRPGWMGFGEKKEINISYKITREHHRWDESSGKDTASSGLFETKELLLASFK